MANAPGLHPQEVKNWWCAVLFIMPLFIIYCFPDYFWETKFLYFTWAVWGQTAPIQPAYSDTKRFEEHRWPFKLRSAGLQHEL